MAVLAGGIRRAWSRSLPQLAVRDASPCGPNTARWALAAGVAHRATSRRSLGNAGRPGAAGRAGTPQSSGLGRPGPAILGQEDLRGPPRCLGDLGRPSTMRMGCMADLPWCLLRRVRVHGGPSAAGDSGVAACAVGAGARPEDEAYPVLPHGPVQRRAGGRLAGAGAGAVGGGSSGRVPLWRLSGPRPRWRPLAEACTGRGRGCAGAWSLIGGLTAPGRLPRGR